MDKWVEVKSPNGNTAQLDMSRLSINDKDVFTFYARSEIDNMYYVYKIKADVRKKVMKIISVEQYNKYDVNNAVSSENINGAEKAITKGSLNEAIILYIDAETKDDIRRDDIQKWLPYYTYVMRKFQKKWKPSYDLLKLKERKYRECELTIDKNGNIVSYNFPDSDKNVDDKAFFMSIKDTINKVGKLKKLPDTYKGETIVIKLAFVYRYNKEDKATRITTDDTGYQDLKILKKYKIRDGIFSSIKAVCDVILCIILLPIFLLAG